MKKSTTRHLLFFLFFALSLRSPAQNLPPINVPYSSYAVTADGKLLSFYGEQHRVELQSTGLVSPYVLQCLLATEDRDFYNHDGVSWKGIGRAIWQTLKGHTQGGSTLTMQLARNLFLTKDQTFERKLKEIDLARELEKKYSKDQIILLYLNTVYFGRGAYGIWAAAAEYFGKTPEKLTVSESAMIIGLLKAPSGYDPSKHPDKALNRRNEVLHNLVEVGKLTEREYNKLRKHPLGLNLRDGAGASFAEHVRREASEILQKLGKNLQSEEFRITTTLDMQAQKAAEQAVRSQWSQLPKPMQNAQIGLVAVEPSGGAIRTMVGGNPTSAASGLNHATQIRRQPGSAFKPFLYGSLLEQGYTLATPILNGPIVIDAGKPTEWRPMNDDETYSNTRVTMKYGIQKSLNLVAAHAITELSSPEKVADFAKRCGINSTLPLYPSLALGTGEVSPLEMASAYSTFVHGVRSKPYAIVKIEDKYKRVVYSAWVDTVWALDPETAYLITNALQAVVDSGTAASVRKSYQGAAAGKTGTTQNFADAWFVGFTPLLATAVWVGFDNPATKLTGAYRYGGTACAPIWARMMSGVMNKKAQGSVVFYRPPTVFDLVLCEDSGLLATKDCLRKNVYPINSLKAPKECSQH
jgi:1A family penicillin-binding protein